MRAWKKGGVNIDKDCTDMFTIYAAKYYYYFGVLLSSSAVLLLLLLLLLLFLSSRGFSPYM